jgi:hypothetical protein
MRRAAPVVALLLPLIAACAGEQREPRAEPAPLAESDAGLGSGEDDELDGGADADAGPDGAVALEELVNEALGRLTKDGGAPHGLHFEVVQRGPNQPWVLLAVNQGSGVVKLAADPRLVELEIDVPGRKKPVTCRLGAAQRPDEVEKEYLVELEPGQAAVHVFDPRLYCFGPAGQDHLVPGAHIEPRLGWPPKTKKRWKKGKLEETLVDPQSPPFVAQVGDDSADAAPGMRVKQLMGPGFSLSSEYQAWARHGLRKPDAEPSPFVLEARRGSDAESVEQARITVALKNRSKKGHHIFFRRELVSFEVMGPHGLVTCDAQPDDRAPERQGYAYLGPGQSLTRTSRIIELCPHGVFMRPGLYLIHARFDAQRSGGEWGLKAFVGDAVTDRPALIRIRKGDIPLYMPDPMRVVSTTPPAQ